ncbi:MAG: GNAT family protein [Pseudomonadota bacterium]
MRHFWLPAENSRLAKEWVAEKLGYGRSWENATAFVAADDEPMAAPINAAIIYHDWQPGRGTIEMTMFSEDPAAWSRSAIAEAFAYPFDRAGCQLVKLSVAPGNQTMRAIAARLGFTETVIRRGRGRYENDILCTLSDDAWRASKFARRHGNALTSRAA